MALHTTKRIPEQMDEQKFLQMLNRTQVDPQTECWLWHGTMVEAGYGVMSINSRTYYTHRVGYTQIKGPIPKDKELHHTCEHPACWNPEHLKAVTRREHRASH